MDTDTIPVKNNDAAVKVETTSIYGVILLADRCDQCGAQAFVRAVHPTVEAWHGISNQDLLFCGHHYRRAQVTLLEDGWTIFDQTDKIN